MRVRSRHSRPASRARPASLVALLAALVAVGCAVAPRADRAAPRAGSSPAPSVAASTPVDVREADGTKTVGEFRRDIADATTVAEEYWTARLTEAGVAFTPIRKVIPYTKAGEVVCAGEPLGLNNAAYCSDGDFIAYDVNWALGAFRQVGDAFIFYLLGHEYAHAIQVRLGIRKKFTIQQELQADCMAGAYLGDSQRAKRLLVQPSDIAEFRRGLLAVGDDPGQPWFAEGSHGTARQRTEAFVNGYNTSLKPCGLT
jgi:predicted metalloprotease